MITRDLGNSPRRLNHRTNRFRTNPNEPSQETADGFVVLAGSLLRPIDEFVPSAPSAAYNDREKYADRIDAENRLTADVLFRSPSGAASFVYGRSANGFAEWKTSDGRTLGDLEQREQQAI